MDRGWFSRRSVDLFNNSYLADIDFNVFSQYQSYPEEIRSLEPFHRPGCTVTSSMMKSAFCDVCSAFTKAHANFQKSGQGETENGDGVSLRKKRK